MNRASFILVFGAMVLLNSWFFSQSRVDYKAHHYSDEVIKSVYRDQQHLVNAIVETRNSIYPNYDILNNYFTKLESSASLLREHLDRHMTRENATDSAWNDASKVIDTALIDLRQSLYDYFESNSLLRNSQAFLLTALSWEENSAVRNSLSVELIDFLLRTDNHLNTDLEVLENEALFLQQQEHSEDASLARLIGRHMKVVLDTRLQLSDIQKEINTLPLIPVIENVDTQLKKYYEASSRQADLYRSWSYVLTLLLLLMVVIGISRLRETSKRLHTTNLTLTSEAMRHQATQASLKMERERAMVTLESIADGVITTDPDGIIEFINPVGETLTGWPSREAVGRRLEEVFQIQNDDSGQEMPHLHRGHAGQMITTKDSNAQLTHRDGNSIAIETSISPISGNSGEVFGKVIVFHDVTHTRSLTEKLNYQATHDALTGLVNRREFENRLKQIVEGPGTTHGTHSLMFIDMDRFKIINDTCGHVAGDELLRQIADLLREPLRQIDTIARLGGDEFAILLESCTLDKASGFASSICETVRNYRFSWEEHTFNIGASIGITLINPGSGSIDTVMSMADMACYAAKNLGGNRYHIARPEDGRLESYRSEIRWLNKIQEALENDHFTLMYQKIGRYTETGYQTSDFEILLRMQDGDGLIPPSTFIPAAERHNLMPAIDHWVIRKVFESLSVLVASPSSAEDFVCAINLSGASLGDEGLVRYVRQLQQEFNINPKTVCFEITETAAITNLTDATQLVNQLKQEGYSFSLDDFGSGLSSFEYLKQLPVDNVKIDGSFVRDVITNPIDRAMVESINHIGHAMNIQTIADYVENAEVLSYLAGIGVDRVQGYHIHKPEPLENLLDRLTIERTPDSGASAL